MEKCCNIILLLAFQVGMLMAQTCNRSAPRAAVVSNAEECAAIGMAMLDMDGSAVDAAIATILCEGASMPHSLGIGGGFVATVYDYESRSAQTLTAREVAPAAATKNMYKDRSEASYDGPLSIAVPGEIKGYWEMHKKYGRLPWGTLFTPTVNLCRSGIMMTEYLFKMLSDYKDMILSEPSMKAVFINPLTNDLWAQGQRFKMQQLANTLEVIGRDGADAMYKKNGSILVKLMNDLRAFNSILTEDDILNFRPLWSPPAKAKIRNNLSVYSMPPPAGGNSLNYILQILDEYDNLSKDDPLTWHRIVESLKHGFGMRTRLGDPRFISTVDSDLQKMSNPNYLAFIKDRIYDNTTFNDFEYYGAKFPPMSDLGTGHVSVLAPNGDAVAITSTINDVLGAKIRSASTGIILNDQMENFANPQSSSYVSPANYIAPGKRPMTAMSPTIIVDAYGDVRLIVGGGGGTRILSSTALLIVRTMFFQQDLCSSMSAARIHHELAPNVMEYEPAFSQQILSALTSKGHTVKPTPISRGIGYLTAIMRDEQYAVTAAREPRRTGSVAVLNGQDVTFRC